MAAALDGQFAPGCDPDNLGMFQLTHLRLRCPDRPQEITPAGVGFDEGRPFIANKDRPSPATAKLSMAENESSAVRPFRLNSAVSFKEAFLCRGALELETTEIPDSVVRVARNDCDLEQAGPKADAARIRDAILPNFVLIMIE